MTRPCAVCGTTLFPFTPETFTAHEFACYKARPDLIPDHHRAEQSRTLAWETRSAAAHRGARTRKARRR